GSLYESGRGVERNFAKAFEYFEKAARQGDPKAQNNLGALYAHGQGVERNNAWAVFWFVKAARQGNQTAQKNLIASLPKVRERHISKPRVKVRTGPGTRYRKHTRLNQGDAVHVLSPGTGWSLVCFEQNHQFDLGWVASSLME